MQTSKIYKSQIRVIYGHTDQMGIVYYGRYLEYFEHARNEALRQTGIKYTELENNNIYLPVTHASINYHKPAKYDDLLNIHCTIQQDIKSRLKYIMNCEIYNNYNQELLVSGHTEHIIINQDGRPYRPRGQALELLNNLNGILFGPLPNPPLQERE